jgi:hypothetical protein
VSLVRPPAPLRLPCWRARYLKEVDAAEATLRFWQEVYDDQGKLVEIHEKFPMDKGHQKV